MPPCVYVCMNACIYMSKSCQDMHSRIFLCKHTHAHTTQKKNTILTLKRKTFDQRIYIHIILTLTRMHATIQTLTLFQPRSEKHLITEYMLFLPYCADIST